MQAQSGELHQPDVRRPQLGRATLEGGQCDLQVEHARTGDGEAPAADACRLVVQSVVRYGVLLKYMGLFASAFIAATILPFASEVPLALLVRASGRVVGPVAVATLGNYLGACTTYFLVRAAVKRARPAEPNSRALSLMRRFGAPALALSWVPIVGDALVALAGAARIGFGAFSFWIVLGKLCRYAVVAWAVRRFDMTQ